MNTKCLFWVIFIYICKILFAYMGFSKSGINLGVCAYCKCELDEYSRTIDHLYPKSRGGKLSNSNKVPCCGDCNKMKGDMSVWEFSKALGGLMFYEHTRHKESLARLKKIKLNVDSIIDERKRDRVEGQGSSDD